MFTEFTFVGLILKIEFIFLVSLTFFLFTNIPEIKKLFFYPVFYYAVGLGLALLWKLLLKLGKERMIYEYTAKERNT